MVHSFLTLPMKSAQILPLTYTPSFVMTSIEGDKDTIAYLVQLWTLDHANHLEWWESQWRAAAQATEEADHQCQAQEEEAQLLAEQEAEKEHRESKKKKPKINDFDESKHIPNVLLPRPSQYAIQKLKQFKYVELWYFSPDGYRDAARESRSTADDALGITKNDDVLTLKPTASVKASKNALLDHELPIAEFFQAKNTFLQQAKMANWPEKHINALSFFYWNLEVHPMRILPHGDKIILTYASRVRHQWHDDLKADTAGNISTINLNLIQSIGFKINAKRQEEILRCHEAQMLKVSQSPILSDLDPPH